MSQRRKKQVNKNVMNWTNVNLLRSYKVMVQKIHPVPPKFQKMRLVKCSAHFSRGPLVVHVCSMCTMTMHFLGPGFSSSAVMRCIFRLLTFRIQYIIRFFWLMPTALKVTREKERALKGIIYLGENYAHQEVSIRVFAYSASSLNFAHQKFFGIEM